MTAIKLEKFGGMLPAWNTNLLPEGQADYALNTYLFSGALIGWRQPKLLYVLRNSATKYAYRVPNKDSDDTRITALDSFWMEFADPDTTVIRTPVVNDRYLRHYWASPSDRPRYNTYDRILAGAPPWILGVPAPGCTPGVEVTGGGDTAQVGNVTVLPEAGGSDFRPGNSIFLTPIVPKGSMLIESVSFVPTSTDGGVNFQAVVYADVGGAPSELIGVGNQVTGITTNVTATSTISNGVSVISDVTYWVGIALDTSIYVKVADTRITNGRVISNTYSNSPPDIPTSSGNFPVWNMWGNLRGASVFTARAYVYTWVTEYGEEGPPSPPAVVNGWSNATWTVSMFMPEPNNMGVDRNIKWTNVYRSITNQTGQGTYFLVAQIPEGQVGMIPVTQGVYQDTNEDDVVSINPQLASLDWFEPPEDLQGFKTFPNGLVVSWKDNEIWFSEAYRPHAWPRGYVLTCEFPVVGVGVCGQAVVVCTQGSPYLVTGVNPSSMGLSKINLPEPCMHKGSIVTTDTTVLYISQNGLIQISASGQGANVTEPWISRERWQELVPLKHVRAVKHATSYFAFGSVAPDDPSVARRGFTVELSQQDQTSFTIWPQAGGHRLGFTVLSSPVDIDNLLIDPWTGVGLAIQENAIYYWDFTDLNPIYVPYKWKSKTYQHLSAKNFSAMKLWFTVPSTTPPQVARDTSDPQLELGANQYGIVRVYADGQLYTTRELRKSGELLRIYSTSKYESWSFEVEARVLISNWQIATSVKELGLV